MARLDRPAASPGRTRPVVRRALPGLPARGDARWVVDAEGLADVLGQARHPGGAIALIGGADGLGDGDAAALRPFFAALAGSLEAAGAALVDGGTDSGVMRLVGEAREAAGAGFRLVGVLPAGVLGGAEPPEAAVRIAPGHEVIVVPGRAYGDESRWLFAAADRLAGDTAPTLVVNGGPITRREAEGRLAAGGLVVVVDGSGRAADALATGAPVLNAGRLRVLSIDAGPGEIGAALELGGYPPSGGRENMSGPAGSAAADGDHLGAMIDALDLDEFRREVLRHRWLDQVRWIDGRARRMRVRHYALRLPVVVGSVAVPALVSVTLNAVGAPEFEALKQVTFAVSLGVAMLGALEAIFQFGERWHHYRGTAERLKSTGWQYLQLSGPFRGQTHASAFAPFCERVEEILTEDVQGYLSRMIPGEAERRAPEVVG